MQNQEAYNRWSATYDTVINKTRDVEAMAFRILLSTIQFSEVIELGCGTGKNTEWLSKRATKVTAVDFSEEMQNEARKKITTPNVDFVIADVTKPWAFVKRNVQLVSCSLVLEHIENLDFVFQQASSCLQDDGFFYVGELHPFKQYQGSKARFDDKSRLFTLDCFTHHISDYMEAASKNKFSCLSVREWFDEEKSIPRIVSFLFQKINSSAHF